MAITTWMGNCLAIASEMWVEMVSAALDGKWNEWPFLVNEINIEMNSHISF